ncbi:hypothetical protein Acr_00g0078680 [Actinidia rufa]|uniref:Uncharacterized protein n=1 Tax=Actinidia rufa TaxID=165716 RepID=A0A7J0DU72_9ERIC|nr:hypothetical protein Acr_00g0078680 [Actinidia rufa]
MGNRGANLRSTSTTSSGNRDSRDSEQRRQRCRPATAATATSRSDEEGERTSGDIELTPHFVPCVYALRDLWRFNARNSSIKRTPHAYILRDLWCFNARIAFDNYALVSRQLEDWIKRWQSCRE